jgi:hypothetical protein
MGGNAFTGLSCPRLSPEQYYVIRDRSLAILKDKFYAKVICPPEAPSKEDHGDIDLLASEPTHTFTVGELSSALGAIRNTREGKTTSFAVPLSETPNTSNSNKGLPTTSTTSETQTISTTSKPDFTSTTTTKSYVQIDVHVCVPGYLEWELFHSSYGDLMQILGVMNRYNSPPSRKYNPIIANSPQGDWSHGQRPGSPHPHLRN